MISDCFTNVEIILKEYLTQLGTQIPKLSYVYEEDLNYESILKSFMATPQGDTSKLFPCFAFRAEVLRESTIGPSRRHPTLRFIDKSGSDTSSVFKILQGELEIEYMFLVESLNEFYKHSILALSNEGLTSVKEFKAYNPDVGEDNYFVDHREFEAKTFSVEDNYYKGLSGRFILRGPFYIFKGESPVITEIQATIKSYEDLVYKNLNINS